MSSNPPPTTIVELTIRAHEERRERWNWDFVICTIIRSWEKHLRQEWEKREDNKRPRGSLAWYHWHEICDRVFFRLSERLEELREAVQIRGEEATQEEANTLWEAGRAVLPMVAEECEVSWEQMYERLDSYLSERGESVLASPNEPDETN